MIAVIVLFLSNLHCMVLAFLSPFYEDITAHFFQNFKIGRSHSFMLYKAGVAKT